VTFETILFSKGDDGIARVSLNRPKVRNAINEQMQAELREAWRDIRYDSDVRCVILSAEGDHFCTGIDRAEAVSEENNAAMAAGDYPGYPTPWMYDDPGREIGPKARNVKKTPSAITSKTSAHTPQNARMPKVRRGIKTHRLLVGTPT